MVSPNHLNSCKSIHTDVITPKLIIEGQSTLPLTSFYADVVPVSQMKPVSKRRTYNLVELILLSGTCCHNCCLNEQTIFVLEIIAGAPLLDKVNSGICVRFIRRELC